MTLFTLLTPSPSQPSQAHVDVRLLAQFLQPALRLLLDLLVGELRLELLLHLVEGPHVALATLEQLDDLEAAGGADRAAPFALLLHREDHLGERLREPLALLHPAEVAAVRLRGCVVA